MAVIATRQMVATSAHIPVSFHAYLYAVVAKMCILLGWQWRQQSTQLHALLSSLIKGQHTRAQRGSIIKLHACTLVHWNLLSTLRKLSQPHCDTNTADCTYQHSHVCASLTMAQMKHIPWHLSNTNDLPVQAQHMRTSICFTIRSINRQGNLNDSSGSGSTCKQRIGRLPALPQPIFQTPMHPGQHPYIHPNPAP